MNQWNRKMYGVARRIEVEFTETDTYCDITIVDDWHCPSMVEDDNIDAGMPSTRCMSIYEDGKTVGECCAYHREFISHKANWYKDAPIKFYCICDYPRKNREWNNAR